MIINNMLINKNKHIPGLARLLHLDQPVKNLYYSGDNFIKLLNSPRVAIVGSRKVSEYGRMVTEHLTKELVDRGVVIISGLAIGVDSIAHQTALNNNGQTIAVLPSTIDNIYPVRHQGLADSIFNNGGALVTEYYESDNHQANFPLKYQFIARNRIIAALADVVVITEAAERSGSLHTANFAIDLGVEVLAVPGNITSKLSVGTNSLIRQGAQPVLGVEDIITQLELAKL